MIRKIKSKIFLSLLFFIITLFMSGCVSEKNPKLPYYGVFTQINGELVELKQYIGEPSVKELTSNNPVEIDFQHQNIYLWQPEIDTDTLYLYSRDDFTGFIDIIATPLKDGIFQVKPAVSIVPGFYCLAQGGLMISPSEIPFWCFQAGPNI